jgi:cytochrome P450 family 2 subfamily J
LTMGEQPGYENEEILQLMHKFRGILNNNMFTTPHFMFPTFFKYISPLLFLVPGSKHVINVLHGVIKFLQGKIDEHEQQFDPTQESRDYIEAFLLEKRKQDSANPGKNFYTAKELQRIVFDLFIAGTDTTSNSLSWGLLYLAIHPAIQMKCHEEIDATIGREKQPTMKDKEQMPYIQAVLDEIQRYASIVPTGVIHRTFQSDTIHGYHIPGDTLIIPFVYGVHHDPRVWKKPEEFYPQHFITTNVDGKIKYSPREELIPFLIGKRECPGESLAKMEFFLFFVSILQKYDVSLPDYEDSEIEEILMGTDGPIHSPGHHDLLFHPRH